MRKKTHSSDQVPAPKTNQIPLWQAVRPQGSLNEHAKAVETVTLHSGPECDRFLIE